MIELVYISKAVSRFNQCQLEALLSQSRTNNSRLDITGLLLYDGYGTFIQALEGPENNTEQLFQTIKLDRRHTNVHKISYRHITTRSFPDWQMGFKQITDTPIKNLPGYSQFMACRESTNDNDTDHSFALRMLRYFRDG